MIERAIAVRYDAVVEQGRTEPLRVTIELQNGNEKDLILKPTINPHLAVEGLMNEMLAAVLASDLGIRVPEPFLVELHQDFVESVEQPTVRQRLRECCPLAFGTTDAGSEWRRWDSFDQIKPEARSLALSIFAFDGFVGNPDRSLANPNLLIHKSDPRLLAIDHECAFGFRMKLFPKVEPWVLGNLSPMSVPGADAEHVFFRGLRGQAGLVFDDVGEAWKGLSDVRFAEYEALLPNEWEASRNALLDALEHFRRVRANIDACIAELRRVLQ